jgi:hypothetical protein
VKVLLITWLSEISDCVLSPQAYSTKNNTRFEINSSIPYTSNNQKQIIKGLNPPTPEKKTKPFPPPPINH